VQRSSCMRRRLLFVLLAALGSLAVMPLAVPTAARADTSLDAPAGRCAAALAEASDKFIDEIGGDKEGVVVHIDVRGVRVTYFASLDMCGIYDDYRARTTPDGRIGMRVVYDDGHHAAAFERRFRPALRACLSAR
jgi:hypothetical protein